MKRVSDRVFFLVVGKELVLIPKLGYKVGADEIPKVRPIYLLNETGKALERIIAKRLKQHMRDNPQSNLSPWQFGFRDGKCTYDAIAYVQMVAGTAISEGSFTIGVSIDICNAFNSIPWSVIRQALINKQFPEYLLRIIDSYLHNRTIEYRLCNEERPFISLVSRRVPFWDRCYGT